MQSDAEAMIWYKKAADQGMAEAERTLGYLYMDNNGVLQSIAEAMHWFKKAADQGDAKALNELDILLEQSSGISRSDMEAVKEAADEWHVGYYNSVIQDLHLNGNLESYDEQKVVKRAEARGPLFDWDVIMKLALVVSYRRPIVLSFLVRFCP